MQRPGSLVIVLEDSFRKLDQFDLVLHQESSLSPPQRLRRVNCHLYLVKRMESTCSGMHKMFYL